MPAQVRITECKKVYYYLLNTSCDLSCFVDPLPRCHRQRNEGRHHHLVELRRMAIDSDVVLLF